MAKKIPELSIFFPFWYEEENIEQVVTKAIPVAQKVATKWEIIMVDDGSSDATYEVAKQLSSKYKNLHAISHTPNRGYGAALREGFLNSKYKYVVFNDGDNQFDFSEVDRFIDNIDDADMVIGYRKKRKDNAIRHILMNLLKVWDFVFFGFYFRDIDCGFKMFTRDAIDTLMPLRSEGAMITTEILAKAKLKKFVIKEVEVSHYARKFGDQSGGNIPVVIRAVIESFMLWWDIRNKRV